jgi:hypothetical protein
MALPGLDRLAGGNPGKTEHQKSGCDGICRVGNGAVWRIEVEDFPAFVLVGDKGNDFVRQILH